MIQYKDVPCNIWVLDEIMISDKSTTWTSKLNYSVWWTDFRPRPPRTVAQVVHYATYRHWVMVPLKLHNTASISSASYSSLVFMLTVHRDLLSYHSSQPLLFPGLSPTCPLQNLATRPFVLTHFHPILCLPSPPTPLRSVCTSNMDALWLLSKQLLLVQETLRSMKVGIGNLISNWRDVHDRKILKRVNEILVAYLKELCPENTTVMVLPWKGLGNVTDAQAQTHHRLREALTLRTLRLQLLLWDVL